MKPRAFFFHYNKPASAKARTPKLSVHCADTCHIVGTIDCQVPCRTRIRKTQPRVVMVGRGILRVEDGRATITAE